MQSREPLVGVLLLGLPAHSSTVSCSLVGDSMTSASVSSSGVATRPSIFGRQVESDSSGSRKWSRTKNSSGGVTEPSKLARGTRDSVDRTKQPLAPATERLTRAAVPCGSRKAVRLDHLTQTSHLVATAGNPLPYPRCSQTLVIGLRMSRLTGLFGMPSYRETGPAFVSQFCWQPWPH